MSCDSDDSNDVNNATLKLIKVDAFDSENNLTATTNYIYNDELQLIARKDENGNDIFTYTYDNNRITSIESNGGAIINYVYQDDLIVSSSRTINGSLSPNILEYEYDDLDRLIKTKIYVNGNLSCETDHTFDNQNNVEQSVSFCQGAQPNQHSFEYDEMKNPGSLFFNLGLLKVLGVGNNNLIETYNNDMNLTSSSSYEYNENGYPTVENVTNTIHNAFGPSESRLEYIYEHIE